MLAAHFLDIFAREMGIEPPALASEALGALEAYDFPGNVRELKNIIERALIESGGAVIQPHHLHFFRLRPAPGAKTTGENAAPGSGISVPMDLERAEEMLIERALEQTHGNIAQAARLLGTNRPRIYRFLEKRDQAP